MLETLQKIYGQAFTYLDAEAQDSSAFVWFEEPSGRVFGIRKHAMTENEYQLLTLKFQPIETPIKPKSRAQQLWEALLYEGQHVDSITVDEANPHYLLHIAFKSSPQDIDAYEEAINALLPNDPIILWPAKDVSVIILTEPPDITIAKEIVEVFASDFFIDITVLVGGTLLSQDQASDFYHIQADLFKMARQLYPEKRVFTYHRLIPFLYIWKQENRPHTSEMVFGDVWKVLDNDPELRATLAVYYDHNMNLSTASKALYIHRNSLQYRLEKVAEKTGLDPKNFHDAVTINLALIKHRIESIVKNTQQDA